jgi:hypothetical protein
MRALPDIASASRLYYPELVEEVDLSEHERERRLPAGDESDVTSPRHEVLADVGRVETELDLREGDLSRLTTDADDGGAHAPRQIDARELGEPRSGVSAARTTSSVLMSMATYLPGFPGATGGQGSCTSGASGFSADSPDAHLQGGGCSNHPAPTLVTTSRSASSALPSTLNEGVRRHVRWYWVTVMPAKCCGWLARKVRPSARTRAEYCSSRWAETSQRRW